MLCKLRREKYNAVLLCLVMIQAFFPSRCQGNSRIKSICTAELTVDMCVEDPSIE